MTDTLDSTVQERTTTELNSEQQVNANYQSEQQEILVESNDTLYAYCPDELVDTLGAVLTRHESNYRINDYSIRHFKGKTLCHFQSANMPEEKRKFLIGATELGAWVEPIVSYFDTKLGYTETELLHSSYFLHQKAFSILSTKRSVAQKRFIDLLFVLLLSIVALPVSIIAALIIKLESPGPIFFKQRRTGQYNNEFEVIKFRSMRNDAEKDGAKWATKNDARVTRVGNFIRKTRIDELPQLINVLKGEMSLVGPRPEREVFIADLEKHIPYYRFRHAVKPGVTGLAQVKYPYGASLEDAFWKHKYDIYYIKHQNWKMELKILLLTVKTVLFGMGR